ncbi:SufS family cysteine desulfurase [Thalassotalea sp. M1531]|uniref:cysteine desulfurase n=1 Tax=Thalassotalea algicola TaxID=2716224 RepID=A0A7Y0Q8B6_9GAMM|nr:SufS family cysteine desulfurase [Thalassotalea algicola]NMP32747.1 SufS family cysteine desulfurase [Thalassotalea algicola]
MSDFCPQRFKKIFPLLCLSESEGKPLIYFDNAATTQKPQNVIDATSNYYLNCNANVHRSSHQLSRSATALFEKSRVDAQRFINASSEQEIVWTKGTTEAINIVAQCYGSVFLSKDDEILLSHSEHHANIVPWQEVAKRTGAKIRVLPLTSDGKIDTDNLSTYISPKTAIVACTLISNTVGKVNDINGIVKAARNVGAKILVDAAQAVAHIKIDVQSLDCDFLVYSGHKMFGPTGIGVLFGKRELLMKMPPYQFGGEMIKNVSFSGTTYGELPFKFESGTPNISAVLGLSAAIKFVEEYREQFVQYERALTEYCFKQLNQIPNLTLLFTDIPDIPVFSFIIDEHHNQDIASFLDTNNIAVRAGHHCAMPLMEYLSLDGCIRVSLAPYNTRAEVDSLINVLNQYLTQELRTTVDETSALEDINHRFEKAKGWDGRHREIMMLGKSLSRMPKSLRGEDNLIQGCESDVWLQGQVDGVNHWHFQTDSDAKVIRGLLVIILSAFENKSSEQILDFDIEGYFEQLGLIQHLSPSRGSGVRSIVARIIQIVAESES